MQNNLPTITGVSDKQIQYGEDKRGKILNDLNKAVSEYGVNSYTELPAAYPGEESVTQLVAAANELFTKTEAKYWIEERRYAMDIIRDMIEAA